VHALGGACLAAAGVVLGVLSAMLAIWMLFIGLGLELRERRASRHRSSRSVCR
jgi:hypothetical protein